MDFNKEFKDERERMRYKSLKDKHLKDIEEKMEQLNATKGLEDAGFTKRQAEELMLMAVGLQLSMMDSVEQLLKNSMILRNPRIDN